MKKGISILLIIAMIAIALTGCGEGGSKLTGTWVVDSAELDGAKFSVSELEAMGWDDGMSETFMVLKDGGKAYISEDGDDGAIIDWYETTDGKILLDGEAYTIVDGLIRIEIDDDEILYFRKSSDSQTITQQDEETTEAAVFNETEPIETVSKETVPVDSVTIKQSPDKYTWYIKNYVGKNCASFGYTSLGGKRMDHYGAGYIELVLVTPDGAYIDIETDDDLKQYVVTAQNLAPNTELKYIFDKDSDGNEYDSLISWQSYEEIVLCVKKIGTSEETTLGLTAINPSPDKYTWYIRDYTGRNLASCGYLAISGKRMDHYGAGYIRFVITSDDGTFIDPQDTELLKNYVVTGQSVAPNTELTYVFDTDSDGNEYDSLIHSQNIEEIELTVKPIGN